MRHIEIWPCHYHKGKAIIKWAPERTTYGEPCFSIDVSYTKSRPLPKSVVAQMLKAAPDMVNRALVAVLYRCKDLQSLVYELEVRLNAAQSSVRSVPKLIGFLQTLVLEARITHNELEMGKSSLELRLENNVLTTTLTQPEGQFIKPVRQELLHEIEKRLYKTFKELLIARDTTEATA